MIATVTLTVVATLVVTVTTQRTGDAVVISRDVCKQPVDEGSSSCKSPTPTGAWYYLTKTDKCTYSMYEGCGGNENRFNSLINCEKTCQRCPYVYCPDTCNSPTKDKNGCDKCTCTKGQRLSICKKPLERGLGRALMPRYGWDTKTKSCKEFAYGGLPGNNNNFSTKKECERFCSGF